MSSNIRNKVKYLWSYTLNLQSSSVILLQRVYLEVYELKVSNQGHQQPTIIELLCKLGHSFCGGLLVICAAQNLFHCLQWFRHFLWSLVTKKYAHSEEEWKFSSHKQTKNPTSWILLIYGQRTLYSYKQTKNCFTDITLFILENVAKIYL